MRPAARSSSSNAADTIFSSKWIGLARKTLWNHPRLMAWLVVTVWLGLEVDKRLDRRCSRF